eukprot:6498074-Pyramimonas_sp.AAC.1
MSKSTAAAPRAWIPDICYFQRAGPEAIRRVARAFPCTTSAGLGGLHARHLTHVGDDALGTLAILLEAMELLGMLPKQRACIIMPMLPKPQGGHRLIILHASAH